MAEPVKFVGACVVKERILVTVLIRVTVTEYPFLILKVAHMAVAVRHHTSPNEFNVLCTILEQIVTPTVTGIPRPCDNVLRITPPKM